MGPWGTFPCKVHLCVALDPAGALRGEITSRLTQEKQTFTLREEFLDSTAQRCDVMPGGRFRQRVHISAGVRSDRAVPPHRGRARVLLQTGRPLSGTVQQWWSLWIVGLWLSFRSRHSGVGPAPVTIRQDVTVPWYPSPLQCMAR